MQHGEEQPATGEMSIDCRPSLQKPSINHDLMPPVSSRSPLLLSSFFSRPLSPSVCNAGIKPSGYWRSPKTSDIRSLFFQRTKAIGGMDRPVSQTVHFLANKSWVCSVSSSQPPSLSLSLERTADERERKRGLIPHSPRPQTTVTRPLTPFARVTPVKIVSLTTLLLQ